MKSTSPRPIDELGRVVLPIGIRRALDIKERDTLEFFTEGDRIIIKKVQSTCCFCEATEALTPFADKCICPDCLKKLKAL